MKPTSLEILESNFNKLNDISNSCESLMRKIGQLQVDLFNHPDKDLERFLEEMNSKFSELHENLIEELERYENEKIAPEREA